MVAPDFAPTLLYPLTIPDLLNHVLAAQASAPQSTTILVCSARDDFLQECARIIQYEREGADHGFRQLLAPTLHNLARTRHVNIAFCPSVPALLAHLTVYDGWTKTEGMPCPPTEQETLILVNPLALHAPTPSFSAQGLSRTFATAVETAARLKAKLVLVECVATKAPPAEDDVHEEDHVEEEDLGRSSPAEVEEDPWAQEVPILNVSIRKYGSAGNDRPWAGRTVQARRIALRWFHFVDVQKGAG